MADVSVCCHLGGRGGTPASVRRVSYPNRKAVANVSVSCHVMGAWGGGAHKFQLLSQCMCVYLFVGVCGGGGPEVEVRVWCGEGEESSSSLVNYKNNTHSFISIVITTFITSTSAILLACRCCRHTPGREVRVLRTVCGERGVFIARWGGLCLLTGLLQRGRQVLPAEGKSVQCRHCLLLDLPNLDKSKELSTKLFVGCSVRVCV